MLVPLSSVLCSSRFGVIGKVYHLGGWCFILFEVLIGGGLVIFIEDSGVVELATDDSVILLTAETIESTESVLVRYNSEANSNLTDLLINYRLETVMIRKWKIIDNTVQDM